MKQPFDPTTLDHAALVATNRRLNRRCQRLEHRAAKWRRRYAALRGPVEFGLDRLDLFATRLRAEYRWLCKYTQPDRRGWLRRLLGF